MMKNLPWHELKEWLSSNAGGSLKIAKETNKHRNTVYRWANGTRIPEADDLVAIYRATDGEVSYRSSDPEKASRTWPRDMFREIDDWKKKDDRS